MQKRESFEQREGPMKGERSNNFFGGREIEAAGSTNQTLEQTKHKQYLTAKYYKTKEK